MQCVRAGLPGAVAVVIGEIVESVTGTNLHPVPLMRPRSGPLSAVALLDKQIFSTRACRRPANSRARANCAGCHLSQPGAEGPPPLFTDTQYEALGVPRNTAQAIDKDPKFFDMGVCGPFRDDLATQTQYCGIFPTPTLRNAAERKVFFHNGVYHDLKQVMDFYSLRDTSPGKIHPRDASGNVQKYNDLPPQYRANIDSVDAPFDRKPGEQPAMTDQDIEDIIAFMHTISDGYRHRDE